MNLFTKIWRATETRAYGFALNIDRAVDNLVIDDGVDHTISGDAETHAALKPLEVVLDATLPGGPHGDHCANASYDDAAQTAALNEAESGEELRSSAGVTPTSSQASPTPPLLAYTRVIDAKPK